MSKELIINATDHETRVAFVENGNPQELFIERPKESDIAGNIYKGRVLRVLPGMQAAFVDIGLNQAAFIYVDDVFNNYHEFEGLMRSSHEEDENDLAELDTDERPLSLDQNFMIEELLHEGQEVMVQVSKAPIGGKGARITSRISLPGRFLVLMPTTDHIGVSRRIEDENERKRLRETLAALRPDNYGLIARTVSEGVSSEKLANEMNFLVSLWQEIQKKNSTASVPKLLHQELNVTLRAVRDLFTQEVDKLVIDSRAGYEQILQFLDTFMPRLKDSVELYEDNEPIFDAYNLESEISRALKKKVWLKSGGYIVIEHTEAFVAIDVNTGRFVGKRNLEETILKTNLEAVKEIAYQIRLRDIGGLIIIDFIDMEKKSNRERVFNALQDALKKDRSKTNVLPMSDLGLIEMTRKRTRETLNRMLCEPCFYCEGEGYLKSKRTICYNIFRDLRREAGEMMAPGITLKVHPEVAEMLLGEERDVVESLERSLSKQIMIRPDPEFHLEQYEMYEIHKN
ncbi:MAG: Rne/Rng family ribonuclease [Deltaproteobacteria bacterium]|nr:Rne/Rng family ribonuclease [Deltaproteobacteria bacterium]MBW2018748.1 Rne/Rng family ribonuclease [Deltaproteobacteria bacterium]MBW2073477.1 Rne/Rng family ribonuclease [Deltaproteobacteria bacterium]RLB83017.1 MAG: Rne/Rng family ribonuclease [Deltaproteobacteria bacterium]